jgi:hypothetical protein
VADAAGDWLKWFDYWNLGAINVSLPRTEFGFVPLI